MRMLSLCSGIDGIGLAAKWAGIETVAGVIETTSLGMKGTHIRVLQPEIFDQVAQAAYELEMV